MADEAADRDAPPGADAAGSPWAPAVTENFDDSGPFGTVQLAWRIDMGGANAEDWSDRVLRDLLPVRQFVRLRTPGHGGLDRSGPEFRLTGDALSDRACNPMSRYPRSIRGNFNGQLCRRRDRSGLPESRIPRLGPAMRPSDGSRRDGVRRPVFDFAEHGRSDLSPLARDPTSGHAWLASDRHGISSRPPWTACGSKSDRRYSQLFWDYLPAAAGEVRGWHCGRPWKEDFGGVPPGQVRSRNPPIGAGLRAFATQNFFVEGRAATIEPR